VLNLTVDVEPITTSGALSVFHAATDELNRRYGHIDEVFEVLIRELTPPQGSFLVARVDADLAGGVGIRTIGEPEHRFAEVKRLWVRPDLRRSGVGAQLMTAIEEHARSLSFRELFLETGWAQPEALELYQTNGWIPIDDYPDGAFSHPTSYRFMKTL
jgi:GNAT superfamily N-acetyltransferase